MTEQKEKPTNPVKSYKNNTTMLSIYFMKDLPTIVIEKNSGELYYYNNKFFAPLTDIHLHKSTFAFFEKYGIIASWKSTKAKEIVEAIKSNSKIEEVEFDQAQNLINLDNGTLNLDTYIITPHSEKNLFSYALDVNFNEKATKHYIFDKFLRGLFRRFNHTVDHDTITLVLQIIAYLLYPQIKMEKMFMFIGEGANGKSVLIDIIKNFFPAKYVTSLSLNIMSSEDNFNRNVLTYSRLNISTEQKVDTKINSEELKKIISGEDIHIRKLYKEPISVKPKTKILLAANEFPFFSDTTHGIKRRLTIIDFKNKFVDREAYKNEISPEDRGVYIFTPKDELVAKISKEKSAILNTLLSHLKILRKKDWSLPTTANAEEITEEYTDQSDVLGTWLKENYKLAKNEDNPISSLDVLDEYKIYFQEHFPGKIFKTSSAWMGRKIKSMYRVKSVRTVSSVTDGLNRTHIRRLSAYPIERVELEDEIPIAPDDTTNDEGTADPEQTSF